MWRKVKCITDINPNVEIYSIRQQYLMMACIHSVNGSVRMTGVILLNYDSNHDLCHQ